MASATKRRYSDGSEKSFRIPYGQIGSISGYSNGVSIVRNPLRAQPQYFLNGANEGRFAVNLLNALAQQ